MPELNDRILEVIVTNADEAFAAQAGGADRLELVRALDLGGLTPELSTVQAVLRKVAIPVRVMLRDSASYELQSSEELSRLISLGREFASLQIDGLVLGYIHDSPVESDNASPKNAGKIIDRETIATILTAIPGCRATIHRAFEGAQDQSLAIETLKQIDQIDRILTNGIVGDWPARRMTLESWQKQAEPITILVGGNLDHSALSHLLPSTLREFHIGRAARRNNALDQPIDPLQIMALRSALNRA